MAAPAWSIARAKKQSSVTIDLDSSLNSSDDSSRYAAFRSSEIASSISIVSTSAQALEATLRRMFGFRLVINTFRRFPLGKNSTIVAGSLSALSKTSSHSLSIVENHRRMDSVDSSTPDALAAGSAAISLKLCFIVSLLVASIQKIRQNLRHLAKRRIVDWVDRKSTRLNSSHSQISYAVFCLKKKKLIDVTIPQNLRHITVY